MPLALAQLGERCDQQESLNFLRHPTNCSKYLSCGSGAYVEMDCPARLHFNLDGKFCDWPAHAGCLTVTNGHQTPMSMPANSVENLEITPGRLCVPSPVQNIPRVAPFTKDCTKFLICKRTWKIMNCPRGLLFSIESGHCEHPDDAQCCATCMNPSKSCNSNGELLPNPFDCHKFYICNNGTIVDLMCPKGNKFDAIKSKCVSGATCNEELPVPASDNLPECSTDGSLFPNYQDCSRFFMCSGGVLVEQSCPPQNFFSMTHYTCRPRAFAVCADGSQTL